MDKSQTIQQQVKQALKDKKCLCIRGAKSHDFMLPDYSEDEVIDMATHQGIIDYQPSELMLHARAGTSLSEIQHTLAGQQQRLATDFPLFSPAATLGGAIAMGHSGSGRPFLGAIRDHVLGAGLVTGSADIVNCGGQVMKNVAGYDVSRLLCGSRGTLGPILDISLKVTPIAERLHTLVFELEKNQAIERMNILAGQTWPITASCHYDGKMFIRLEGSDASIRHAKQNLGGDSLPESADFWTSLQQQSHDFFNSLHPIWRIVVPASSNNLELQHQQQSLIDWCGGLRWIQADEITQTDYSRIKNMGGFIESHRGREAVSRASLMTKLQIKMHMKIKKAFDPDNLFNPALSIIS